MSPRLFAVAGLLLALACRNPQSSEGKTSPVSPATSVKRQHTPPQSLRIVTIGDSLAYGAGDESDRGIAGRLKGELEQRGVATVQTINQGVNGAKTADVLTRLRGERMQAEVRKADAIVLSIGANDLFRAPGARERTLRNPLLAAEEILMRITEIVAELHRVNPRVRILILGGYNPVPGHPQASQIQQYLGLWDAALAGQFDEDRRVAVVKMADIVVPENLSRYDNFHPGGKAYAQAAERIAVMLLAVEEEISASSSPLS